MLNAVLNCCLWLLARNSTINPLTSQVLDVSLERDGTVIRQCQWYVACDMYRCEHISGLQRRYFVLATGADRTW